MKRRMRRAWWGAVARRAGATVGPDAKINRRTRLTPATVVGRNFNSNGLEIHGSGVVTIGDNFHCGKGCQILTSNHNYEGAAIPYDESYDVREVMIGDNVWLGIDVTILPGVAIGEGAIVQAGSVVTSDLPPLAIAGGHPARAFAARNSEHYEQAKSNGRFH